jgi:hypothetical protein
MNNYYYESLNNHSIVDDTMNMTSAEDREGIVQLDVGWDQEIRPKGIRILEAYLSGEGQQGSSRALFSKV